MPDYEERYTDAEAEFKRILEKFREKIIKEWINRLHVEVSERYSKMPVGIFKHNIPLATDAYYEMIVNNRYSKIDQFIQRIAQDRLEEGFLLSEVQKAFELYRKILTPIVVKEIGFPHLLFCLERLNFSQMYVISKFSNYFQSLHEKGIRDYANDLEREVNKRTKLLVESEANYRVLVEEINDGYFVSKDGVVVFANKTFCKMHGYEDANEVIGRPYTDFIAPASLKMVTKFYEERLRGESVENNYIFLRKHKDGKFLPTENVVSLIYYKGRKCVAGVCRDITKRMEMEKRIRDSERLAHIGQLTTSLAHEIRNPLSSIKINAQILDKGLNLQGNDERRMKIIIQELSRLERILREMLDFAKPIEINLEFININSIIETCLDILKDKIEKRRICIRKRLSKNLIPMLLDRDKMEQAIINILLNSLEVLQEGGEVQIITKMMKIKEKAIYIEISDNGPGVDEESLKYIFDPFFSKKKKGIGTGLGLSNVKKIIDSHGGEVKAFLKKPKGMGLIIKIPGEK